MNKRTSIFILILAIGFTGATFGQISKAKKEMSLYNYSGAIQILQKTLKKEDPKTKDEATLLLAKCYRKQNDMPNAKAWYAKVIGSGKGDSLSYYYYAQALRSCGDYSKAKEMFLHYDSLVSKDRRGRIFASFCDSAIAWESKPPAFDVKNAATLNTKQSDFGPAFFENGVMFASDRIPSKMKTQTYGWTGNSFLHLFTAEPLVTDDYYNDFNEPALAPGLLNQEYHDGPAVSNKIWSELFINRTFIHKDKGKKEENSIRTHLLKIFYGKRKDGKWGKPEPFFLNSDEYSVGHPALSPDAKTLYFVSDIKGGYGGTDLYMCTREGDKWSKPVNLGEQINTFGNEMFPFIADNGDLFFSSDGLPGYGGLDIFVSHNVNGQWTKPENLGKPLNSSFDDFSLADFSNTGKGLFSSNRPDGKGSDDLYSYRRIPTKKPLVPVQPMMISGCVKDKVTGAPLPGATVFLLESSSGKILVIKTNEGGCFTTPVKKGSSYVAKAMERGYIADCLTFTIDPLETKTDLKTPRDLLLDKLALNRKFVLENIYYDFDKSFIRKDAEPSLNNLIRIMNENPISVELGSHTDCRGSDEYNIRLSQRRAESAVQYIISKGIDAKRITAHGYGETQLVNRCSNGVPCSPEEHQANRRTEFKVTSVVQETAADAFDPRKFRDGEILDSRFLPDGFFSICYPGTK
ncbi:MAG: OmpA family protein [Bacteroidetes bacterium]|nr:OmpA family protein [Bacteroidota bacterium]